MTGQEFFVYKLICRETHAVLFIGVGTDITAEKQGWAGMAELHDKEYFVELVSFCFDLNKARDIAQGELKYIEAPARPLCNYVPYACSAGEALSEPLAGSGDTFDLVSLHDVVELSSDLDSDSDSFFGSALEVGSGVSSFEDVSNPAVGKSFFWNWLHGLTSEELSRLCEECESPCRDSAVAHLRLVWKALNSAEH